MNESEIKNKFSNEANIYYGHGTGAKDQDRIESIFKNGLRCSHNQLSDTTITLGQGSAELFKKSEEIMNNWEHLDSKQIIIASIPKDFHLLDFVGTPLYGKRQAAYYNSISQEQSQELGIVPGLYLKPEFVMGVYDADTKDFISNRKYYENLPEEDQKKLMDEVKRQYIEILKESGWSLIEYSQMLKECNIENPLTDKEIEEGDKEVFSSQMLETQLDKMAKFSKFSDIEETTHTITVDTQQEKKENLLESWSIDDEW